MSESIQAPKRKYTRKPKVVESVTLHTTGILSDSEQSTTSTTSSLSLTPPECVSPQSTRSDKRLRPLEPRVDTFRRISLEGGVNPLLEPHDEPQQKPKRQYKKKVAVTEPVVDVPPPPVLQRQSNCVESQTTRSDKRLRPLEPRVDTFRRISLEGGVNPLVEPHDEPRIRLDTELIDTPPSSPEPRVSSRTSRTGGEPREKKPRTEKQLEAFNKMREARLKKTEELKHLKEIEKQQRQLEKEEKKLETLNDRIVEKATAIKQRKSRNCVSSQTTRSDKRLRPLEPRVDTFRRISLEGGVNPLVEPHDEPRFDVLPEPQYIPQIQETKHKAILFV